MTTHTVALKASDLHRLVKPVLPFADRGPTIPVLQGVRVVAVDGYLTAAATDRYRMGMQRVAVPGLTPGIAATISARSLRQILALFKPTRGEDPELTLTFDDTTVSVAGAATLDGFLSATAEWALTPGDYPKLSNALRDSFTAEPVGDPAASHAVNAHLLADFRHAVTGGEPLVVTLNGPERPIAVRVGEDFIGLLMPKRASTTPRELDPSWVAILTPEPAATAKPEPKPARKTARRKEIAS